MTVLIWVGAAISVLGLAGVVWSIVGVARARRQGLDDAALRARIGRMMPVNLASFMSAMLGLMMVLVGVILS
ncbi:hypothetical protein SAMN04488003_101393 [Loktanella fryxellensis]|uniref:Uncharacterized protein n=1 Tax=Loktanella fryxellensis TaxID=245187 RepID=A0A1H7Z2R8_9RHOB|nr:hypothetical protein [Loktanella fryxellensis]SEM51759.1 hypothetical protein SAMN04488003_101393 [Loktanella fryxellensis]